MALFRSDYRGFVQVVRHRTPKAFNHVTGEPTEHYARLAAEFGVFGPEYQLYNPETGAPETVADIRGGFFDSYQAQSVNNWTDDEREAVEEKLREVSRSRPDYVREIVAQHVAAPLPWQTYDATDVKAVAGLAETLELVPEVIRYETENLNRAAILNPLRKLLAEMDEDAQGRAQPIMEIPAGELTPSMPHGVRIGVAPETTDTGIVRSTPGFVEKPQPHNVVV